MSDQHSVMELMPEDTPSYMAPAWLSAVTWAATDLKATYELETGNRVVVGATPLDRMIDEATGRDWATVKAFVAWFNENVWGPM